MYGIKQNIEEKFEQSKRVYADKIRFLTKTSFTRFMKNGEKTQRRWLVYSPSRGYVVCAPCTFFGNYSQPSSFEGTGFNDWKHVPQRFEEHENSDSHKNCVIRLRDRGNTKGRVDKSLIEQLEAEIRYWRNVLARVVATVKMLAARGLAFRGKVEKFGNAHNGNYMGCLELIAQFDPFLKQHITNLGNPGTGNVSYLSSTICDEFIAIIHKKLKETILKEIRNAKYFGLSVDSTPDVSHTDQLALIIRYVTEEGNAVERFLQFLPNVGHKGEEIAEAVLDMLNYDYKLKVEDCRGQSYDNASNMSGMYSGVQTRIKQKAPNAEYCPCAAHSLNLVGSCAAETCTEAVAFFDFLQELYNFFSSSTSR